MYKIEAEELGYLQEAMAEHIGDTEKIINEVLYNEAGPLIKNAVHRLIPLSTVKPWKGKPKHAREADSLLQVNYNLAVKITTKSKYGYLYFPDDGTNTKNHVGEQRFFERGGDSVVNEIVERCIAGLYGSFDKWLKK